MQQLNERFEIDTPENVAFGYEVAGLGSRFLAALIDTTLILLLQILANLLVLIILNSLDNLSSAIQSGALFDGSLSWVLAVMGLISFLFLWGYYIFFELLWNGQSPGKAVVKLRVVRTDGTPIAPTDSVIRNLVRIIDFLPIYYGIGVVTMFINSQSRRLGDLAAGTLVVREGAAKMTLQDLNAAMAASQPRPVSRPASSASPTPSRYPVERLTNQDVQMIESFLSRRAQIGNRAELAQQLARSVSRRMELDQDPLMSGPAEDFLAHVLAEYRDRASRG